jgi:hypothetical protein
MSPTTFICRKGYRTLKRAAILILLSSAALCAQTVAPFQITIPIDIVVNFPPPQLVAEKYGPLPKWAIFGEVIGCNRGSTGVTYGEGDVIALLRTQSSLQAFSIQDAISLVGNSQSDSLWNKTKAFMQAGANSVVQSKAAGLIGGGTTTGVGIVVGAQAISILLPNLQSALSLKQIIQYSKDGLQVTMTIPAGRCTMPYSVLFATPGPMPLPSKTVIAHAEVPPDR